MFNWFCLQSLSPLNLNQETSTFETEFLEALTAFLADTLLVWNHASYMSGKVCCFEQRVLVKEPLCHCYHSDWSDLIFQLRTGAACFGRWWTREGTWRRLYLPESKNNRWRGKEVGGRMPWNQMRKLRFWSGTLLAQKVVMMSVTVQFAQFSSPFVSRCASPLRGGWKDESEGKPDAVETGWC